MGCCGDREKALTEVTDEQKWDFINLSDFQSTSCLTPLSYVWLWILIIVSVAVYAADAFTAVNLLAFDKWTSEVKPPISLEIAKWIFSGCIIVSYVFLGYRWFRAWRVVRSGSVTESYLEPLAAIWQSIRLTREGQGWRRFLVFAELTKSRKGVDYLALFVHFQFKGALLIIVAQGPRIAINAMTLWAVMQAQIIPTGDHAAPKDKSSFEAFFMNIKHMIDNGNKRETVIYFTMLFSLVIWAIAALSLILSVIFYVFFLWHYVPSSDGTLTNYCRRKIETRLERIAHKKVRKALEKEDLKRRKEEEIAIKKGNVDGNSLRAPTMPKLGGRDDDADSMYSVTTVSTVPQYSSLGPGRSNTSTTNSTTRSGGMKPTLPSLSERSNLNRSDTSFSTASYATDAPLLSQAGDMGTSSPPPMPPLDRNGDYFSNGNGPGNWPMPQRPSGPPGRSYSPMPQGPPGRSYSPMPQGPPGRSFTPMSEGRASPQPQRGPLPPLNTSYSNGRGSPAPQVISPLPNDPRSREQPFPNRGPRVDPTFSPYDNRAPRTGPAYEMSPVEITSMDNGQSARPFDSYGPNDYQPPQLPSALRSGSPAPQSMNNHFSPPPSRSGTALPRAGLPAGLQSAIQRREASQPLPNRGPNLGAYQQRSATAPLQKPGWGQGPSPRSNSAAPGAGGYRGY